MDQKVRVSVILPCCGMEPGLQDNIAAVLNQDIPDYEVLLVTTGDDASLSLLRRLADEQPGRAQVVVAARATACAQKLANQLAALREADPASEVFVFVDSDGTVAPDFVRLLIEPLADPSVGLSTGWRWYVPVHRNLASYVRSAWNAGAMPFLVDNRHNIAFGGAMAIRRVVFERSGAGEIWKHALSDGLSLARAVKQIGFTVRFAPRAIAVSEGPVSSDDLLEWTNRQATISRVYMPEFWRFTAIAHAMSTLWIVAASVLGWLTLGWAGLGAVVAVYLGLMQLSMLRTLAAARQLLQRRSAADRWGSRMGYLLATPLATWLYSINVLRSLCSRRIVWRGIAYQLVSATETRVGDRGDIR